MRARRKKRWPGVWFAVDLLREDAWMPRPPASAELQAELEALRLILEELRRKRADTAKPTQPFGNGQK
jgi:hypothetical protein